MKRAGPAASWSYRAPEHRDYAAQKFKPMLYLFYVSTKVTFLPVPASTFQSPHCALPITLYLPEDLGGTF